MNAKKTLKTSDEALNFNLERKTARIILKISAFTEQFESTATIKHVRIVSKASTAADETQTIDITPFAQNSEGEIGGIGTTYTALVAPGKVVAMFYFTNDMSDAKPLTMTTNVTAAGSSYIYNLNVGKKKIEVTGIKAGPWTPASETTTGDLICYPYVTFTAKDPQTFKISYKISSLEYSVNNGKWATVEAGTEVPFGGANGTLRLRGTNINGTASGPNVGSTFSTITFTDKNVKVACTGDIRTLLDWRNYSTVDTKNAKFCYLFKDCSVLTSAPDLPATTLGYYCYFKMFEGCTSLTSAPELKATTLANKCYFSMFSGCTSLTSAPELKATELAPSCYGSMFSGCTSLEKAPELKATTLANKCYSYMFNDCTNLTSAPELKATKLVPNCYYGMFSGCTKLSTVTMLTPSDQITYHCCDNWLYNAGTDGTVSSRTLIVSDEAAYNKLVSVGVLPADYWQKENCTVKAANGTDIK